MAHGQKDIVGQIAGRLHLGRRHRRRQRLLPGQNQAIFAQGHDRPGQQAFGGMQIITALFIRQQFVMRDLASRDGRIRRRIGRHAVREFRRWLQFHRPRADRQHLLVRTADAVDAAVGAVEQQKILAVLSPVHAQETRRDDHARAIRLSPRLVLDEIKHGRGRGRLGAGNQRRQKKTSTQK